MAGWLKKPKDAAEGIVPRPDVELLLPASVKLPEVNRFTPLGSDVPEGLGEDDGEDLEFFAAIVQEVEQTVLAPKEASPVPTTAARDVGRFVTPAVDDMRVFRAIKDERYESDAYDFKLDDVDIADLLEDLETVVVALRQRKAA